MGRCDDRVSSFGQAKSAAPPSCTTSEEAPPRRSESRCASQSSIRKAQFRVQAASGAQRPVDAQIPSSSTRLGARSVASIGAHQQASMITETLAKVAATRLAPSLGSPSPGFTLHSRSIAPKAAAAGPTEDARCRFESTNSIPGTTKHTCAPIHDVGIRRAVFRGPSSRTTRGPRMSAPIFRRESEAPASRSCASSVSSPDSFAAATMPSRVHGAAAVPGLVVAVSKAR